MPALPGQENASLKPAVAALMGAPALPSQENAPKADPGRSGRRSCGPEPFALPGPHAGAQQDGRPGIPGARPFSGLRPLDQL